MASGEVENDNPVILPNPRSGHADPANFLLAHLERRRAVDGSASRCPVEQLQVPGRDTTGRESGGSVSPGRWRIGAAVNPPLRPTAASVGRSVSGGPCALGGQGNLDDVGGLLRMVEMLT